MSTTTSPDRGTTTATATTSWFGIQTLGPVLMILFGLVLMFTPLASVGAAGSVGNAGAQFPKCPPAGGGGQFGGNAGNTAIVFPGDDCPTPTTAAPTTAAPTTAAPTTAAPTTAAPGTDVPTTDAPATDVPGEPAPPVPATPTEGPGSDEQPEVGGITVEAPEAETEVLGATTGGDNGGAAPSSTGHDTAELAFTGPSDSSLLATLLGGTLVLGGGALLFASRRRTTPTC